MPQLDLFALLGAVHNEKHYKAWEKFHHEHPEVYRKLVDLCYEVRVTGRHHYGIKALWERMRWYFHIERGDDDFKLNNNYHAYYARYIMEQHPDLTGFFETRERDGC